MSDRSGFLHLSTIENTLRQEDGIIAADILDIGCWTEVAGMLEYGVKGNLSVQRRKGLRDKIVRVYPLPLCIE